MKISKEDKVINQGVLVDIKGFKKKNIDTQ